MSYLNCDFNAHPEACAASLLAKLTAYKRSLVPLDYSSLHLAKGNSIQSHFHQALEANTEKQSLGQ